VADMSFFRNLFGGKKPKLRQLSHPRDLITGDIIKFQYTKQADLSAQEFEVHQVNTYIYDNIHYPELVLKDRAGNIIYMMVEEEDGEEFLALSKKVEKAKIHDLVTEADLQTIQTQGNGTSLSIADKSKPPQLDGWLVDNYRKVDNNIKGAFIKGDLRQGSSQDHVQNHENFTSHVLEDQTGEYSLEITIYKSGENELSATIYQDITIIEEMWPRSTPTDR
jgi:hypothetical protein